MNNIGKFIKYTCPICKTKNDVPSGINSFECSGCDNVVFIVPKEKKEKANAKN